LTVVGAGEILGPIFPAATEVTLETEDALDRWRPLLLGAKGAEVGSLNGDADGDEITEAGGSGVGNEYVWLEESGKVGDEGEEDVPADMIVACVLCTGISVGVATRELGGEIERRRS